MNCEEIREALWNDRDCQFFEYHGRECIIHPFHGGYELWYGKKRCQVEKAEDVFRVPLFDGRALEEITGEIRYYCSGDEI